MEGRNDFFVSGSRRMGVDIDPTHEAKQLGFISYQLAPGDELQTCPYVYAHRVRKERFARHLTLCRANYVKDMEKRGKQVDFGVCKWNFEHHCPSIELKTHEVMCPNAGNIVDHLQMLQNLDKSLSFASKLQKASGAGNYTETDVKPASNGQSEDPDGGESAQNNLGSAEDDDDDDWEEESQDNLRRGFKSYNPQAKLAKGAGQIIQTMPGITTIAERKNFRQEQFEAFERAGRGFSEEAPPRGHRFLAAESSRAVDLQADLRAKRAKELRQAQRAAALAGDYMSDEHRKRRSDQADVQIQSVLELARAEAASSSASSYRSTDRTFDSYRSSTEPLDDSDTFSEASVSTVKSRRGF